MSCGYHLAWGLIQRKSEPTSSKCGAQNPNLLDPGGPGMRVKRDLTQRGLSLCDPFGGSKGVRKNEFPYFTSLSCSLEWVAKRSYSVTQNFTWWSCRLGSCVLALHETVSTYEHKLRHIGLNRHLKTYTKDPKIYMSILAVYGSEFPAWHKWWPKHKLRHIGTMPP